MDKTAAGAVDRAALSEPLNTIMGSVEQPGRNVRAKSGRKRSILVQGWFEFQRQLDYIIIKKPRGPWRGVVR